VPAGPLPEQRGSAPYAGRAPSQGERGRGAPASGVEAAVGIGVDTGVVVVDVVVDGDGDGDVVGVVAGENAAGATGSSYSGGGPFGSPRGPPQATTTTRRLGQRRITLGRVPRIAE
jgi:hypothetical protein